VYDFGLNISIYKILIIYLLIFGVVLSAAKKISFTLLELKYILLLIILVLWVFLSSFYHENYGGIFSHLAILLLVYYTLAFIDRYQFRKLFLFVFVFGQFIMFMDVYAFLSNSPSNPHVDIFGLGYGGIGVDFTFAMHGSVMAWIIFSGLYLRSQYKVRFNFINYFITTLVALDIFVVVLSQSRSSILAITIGLLIPIFTRYVAFTNKIKFLSFFLQSFGFIICVLSGYFFLEGLREARLSTANSRLNQVLHAIDVLKQNPYFGIGWDMWYPYYDQVHVLHNNILNVTVAFGMPMLIIILLIYLYPIFLIYKRLSISTSNMQLTYFTSIYFACLVESLFASVSPAVYVILSGSIITKLSGGFSSDIRRSFFNKAI